MGNGNMQLEILDETEANKPTAQNPNTRPQWPNQSNSRTQVRLSTRPHLGPLSSLRKQPPSSLLKSHREAFA